MVKQNEMEAVPVLIANLHAHLSVRLTAVQSQYSYLGLICVFQYC